MKILGRLCSLRCTPSECYCERPMLVVDELPSHARATLDVAGAYNGSAGKRDSAQPAEPNYNHAGPVVPAIPGASGSLRVIGDRR